MKCYFCGNDATSREHVPPKQMFRDFPCDKITVPSCELHNTEKSNQDEAIIKGMIYSLKTKKNDLNPSVQKAIEIALPKFNQVKKLVYPSKILNDEDVYNPEIAYITKEADFDEWIKKMSIALIYDAIRYYEPSNDYKNIFVFNSTYYNSPNTGISSEDFIQRYKKKKEDIEFLESFSWQNGWPSGKNNYPKEIYYFKIVLYDDFVIFRHHFYENYLIYCAIKICDKTKVKIAEKLLKSYASP